MSATVSKEVIWLLAEPIAGRPRRSWLSRGDIEPIGRPDTSMEQWRDPASALERLRDWAERHTVETITWYLRDKRVKRWSSRLLRAAAVMLAVAGGVVPLISGNFASVDANTGYALLAVAAGCVAFDHFFGLSAGWMRDIATAQALQRRLARFHLAWAGWQAREAGLLITPASPDLGAVAAPPAPGGVPAAFDLIDELLVDVSRLTDGETAQWVSDFQSAIATMGRQNGPGAGSRSSPPLDPATQGDVGVQIFR